MVIWKKRKPGRVPPWALWDDERLLDLPLCDLGLHLGQTHLHRRVRLLHGELAAKGLSFRPHVWLSTSWFSPDGVSGFAIPFFLAHPRLMRLEHAQMGHVEGGTPTELMRLLRHEAGHAYTTAYRLHRKGAWRGTFGKYSTPYRTSYSPDPQSRNHVLNLDGWYAQSHPAEDFCETFAVWLRPGSNWRRRYADWNALGKLEYVEHEMTRIRALEPGVAAKERTEAVGTLELTLRQYYRRKLRAYSGEESAPEDANLRSFYRSEGAGPPAGPFLRRNRSSLLRATARLTGTDLYTIAQVLKRLAERALQLGLRVPRNEGRLRAAAALLMLETLEVVRGRRLEFHR